MPYLLHHPQVWIHGVLWAVSALKADPMGDIVLPASMVHGWTIFQQPQLFLLCRFRDP